jgi:hypothetical protein
VLLAANCHDVVLAVADGASPGRDGAGTWHHTYGRYSLTFDYLIRRFEGRLPMRTKLFLDKGR